MVELKQCKICKQFLPKTTEFFRENKRALDGFSTCCIICKPIKTQYYLENTEKVKEKQRKWNAENREYKNEYNKDYKKKNKEQFKIWDKEWIDINKEYRQEYYSQYQKEHKEYFNEYGSKRRGEKQHEISDDEWLYCKEYFNDSCAYCGLSYETHKKIHNQDLHRDHVNPFGSNKIENYIPACKHCNSSKKDKQLIEWYNEDNVNFTQERLDKIIKWLENDCKLI